MHAGVFAEEERRRRRRSKRSDRGEIWFTLEG